MSLSGQYRKQLREALINAFRDKSSLEQMLSDQLDKNLDAIAGGDSLETVVFSLIDEADAQGWVPDLICAAYAENPKNSSLKHFVKTMIAPSLDNKLSNDCRKKYEKKYLLVRVFTQKLIWQKMI